MGYPLLLQQTEGPNPVTVALRDSSLPEKELAVLCQLGYHKEYYPGADEPVVQILTHQYKPVPIKGLLSDRESRVIGYADATRAILQALWRDARKVRLLYRKTSLEGFLSKAEFYEEDEFEIRYELEFEVLRPSESPARDEVAATASRLSYAALRAELERYLVFYEQLPPDVITPLPNGYEIESAEDLPIIPPVAFEIDPWLKFRIQAEELHRVVRFLLELLGKEEALNADDRLFSAAKSAWLLANSMRTLLDAWTGEGLSAADQLLYMQTVNTVMVSIDNIRTALD